jgi:hypothetical protein
MLYKIENELAFLKGRAKLARKEYEALRRDPRLDPKDRLITDAYSYWQGCEMREVAVRHAQ